MDDKRIDILKLNVKILENERIDDLERNGYKIIQNPKEFCFGMDAVLLSGYASVNEGEKAIDLGCGNGIIPILLEAKNKGEKYYGLEIQEASFDRAKRSVMLNGLEDKIQIDKGDIKEASKIYGKAKFNVVTSNPPYMNENHGIKNPDEPKAIARHELLLTLEDLIRESAALLVPSGRFYMVHRPHRLLDIIMLMKQYRIEPKRIRFVYPYVDKEANMVLIEGIRGGKPFLKVEEPLIVYNKDGSYTDEIYEIYGKEK